MKNFVESMSIRLVRLLNRNSILQNPNELHLAMRRDRRNILHTISSHFNNSILTGVDVGSGSGLFSTISEDHKIFSVDFDSATLQAKDSSCAEAEHLPFPADLFDFAVALYSMHHFADKTQSLIEMARVTKPAGIIYIREEYPRFRLQRYLLVAGETLSNSAINSRSPSSESTYFLKGELERLCDQLDLEIIQSSSISPLRWIDYLYKSEKVDYLIKKRS